MHKRPQSMPKYFVVVYYVDLYHSMYGVHATPLSRNVDISLEMLTFLVAGLTGS